MGCTNRTFGKGFPFPNAFYGLCNRWICELSPVDLENIPSCQVSVPSNHSKKVAGLLLLPPFQVLHIIHSISDTTSREAAQVTNVVVFTAGKWLRCVTVAPRKQHLFSFSDKNQHQDPPTIHEWTLTTPKLRPQPRLSYHGGSDRQNWQPRWKTLNTLAQLQPVGLAHTRLQHYGKMSRSLVASSGHFWADWFADASASSPQTPRGLSDALMLDAPWLLPLFASECDWFADVPRQWWGLAPPPFDCIWLCKYVRWSADPPCHRTKRDRSAKRTGGWER